MFKNHFIITLFISSLCFVANAQNVVFADTIFKKLLVNTICADLNGGFKPDADADANNDGEIQVSEASGVKGLYLEDNVIQSLEGIKAFKLAFAASQVST